jgi:hypothetical protein
LLKTNDGKTAWIHKRWIRADGTLTAAGTKAMENAKSADDRRAEKKAENDALIALADFDRETEKAFGYRVSVTCVHTDQSKSAMVWMPKSMMNGNQAHSWLVRKKTEEAKASLIVDCPSSLRLHLSRT